MNVASVQAPANEAPILCSCELLVMRRSARVIVNSRIDKEGRGSVIGQALLLFIVQGFSAACPLTRHHYSSIHITRKHTELSQTVTSQEHIHTFNHFPLP